MNRAKNILLKIFFFYILVTVLLTAAKGLKLTKGMKLAGVEVMTEFPSLSRSNFFSGQFQRDIEKWLSNYSGLRAAFVRIDNQINYSFFDYISATPQIIIGKDNCLLSTAYINTYYKTDLAPMSELEAKAKKIMKLQQLLESRNIGFLLMITPSKVSIYPEYIPEYIKKKYAAKNNTNARSNYENIVPLLNKYKINYLDGHSFFVELKKTSPYPLFPKSGIHWNYYSAYFFTVEYISKLEEILNKKLTQLNLEDIEITDTPSGSDDDLADLTNIIFTKALYHIYQYPKISCVSNRKKVFQPQMLFIGGSFLRNIFYYLQRCDLYSKFEFYFYYSRKVIYPTEFEEVIDKKNFDLQKEIGNKNIIVVEANEQTINNIGFGFIEDALAAFKDY